MSEIEGFINKVNNNFRIYQNYINSSKSRTPLFFYHVPKSGGLSFANTLGIAMRSAGLSFSRADTLSHLESLKKINNVMLISSHLNYGIHNQLNASSHRLITFLRDPFYRVRSAYTYENMRQQTKVSVDGFIEFYNKPENQNLACKQLCPRDYSTGCSKTVFKNLNENFYLYCTSDQIDQMITYFISELNLSNVLTERLNETLPLYKIDAAEYKAEVERLNADDVELYNLVKNNPRLPQLDHKGNEEIAMKTIILYEVEKELRSFTKGTEVNTTALFSVLMNRLQNGKETSLPELIGD